MEEKNFLAWHEGDMARMERSNRRLWVVIIILIIVLCGTNAAWVYYESQFQVIEETKIDAEQETDNGNNFIVGGDFNAETKGVNN